jgi:hypothetical protein
MQDKQFSALSAVRALRDQLVARLEANEDFRVLKALDSALAQATRLPPTFSSVQVPLTAGARPLQDEVAARLQPAESASVCADEQPLVFANVS